MNKNVSLRDQNRSGGGGEPATPPPIQPNEYAHGRSSFNKKDP